MPAALRLHLTDAERAEVARRFETTHDAATRLRYQMVLLAADGRTAPQIAPLVRRSPATVERVLQRRCSCKVSALAAQDTKLEPGSVVHCD